MISIFKLPKNDTRPTKRERYPRIYPTISPKNYLSNSVVDLQQITGELTIENNIKTINTTMRTVSELVDNNDTHEEVVSSCCIAF
ncbi:MAG: hypothetical protein Q8R24_04840 [Legionellaceae bacterium]|nr:hypothetical protein [Legionellaceae bacterium]